MQNCLQIQMQNAKSSVKSEMQNRFQIQMQNAKQFAKSNTRYKIFVFKVKYKMQNHLKKVNIYN